MRRIRVIPLLLLKGDGLVKSVRFKNYKYIGDPINAVKIFNDKEVDELCILDIFASKEKRSPNIRKIREIAGEAFMPLSYGGGITSVEEVKEILFNGIEKVVVNSAALKQPELISDIANKFGSQSIVVSIDVKKNLLGRYKVFGENGNKNTGLDAVECAVKYEKLGAGEILLNSIDADGTYSGYQINVLRTVSSAVNIPVIACGGAADLEDFNKAVNEGGASAVAAGSMFVFQRPHNAVLISYPSQKELREKFYKNHL